MNAPTIRLTDSHLKKKCERVTKERRWMIFTWIIYNYSKLENHVFYFRKATTSSQEWKLKLMKSPPSLYVMLHPAGDKPFVNFTILGKNMKPLNDGVGSLLVGGVQRVAELTMDMLSEKSGYLEEDCLTVQCKYLEKSVNRSRDTYNYDVFQQISEVCSLGADLKSMYLEGVCSDFKIRLGFHAFSVHKAILATRCEFFAEMFSVESPKKDDVEMCYNAEPAIFHEILAYIYTGKFRLLTVDAMLGVLKIAIDFKLEDLRDRYLKAIYKGMDVDNVGNVFLAAIKLNHKELKNKAIHFISNNCPSLMATVFQRQRKK